MVFQLYFCIPVSERRLQLKSVFILIFKGVFDVIDTALLRKQQICLGLLKAVRVLLSPQEHLRKIILSSESATVSSEEQTLFQQLMKTAVKPSPIKPIFGREELEVKSYLVSVTL